MKRKKSRKILRKSIKEKGDKEKVEKVVLKKNEKSKVKKVKKVVQKKKDKKVKIELKEKIGEIQKIRKNALQVKEDIKKEEEDIISKENLYKIPTFLRKNNLIIKMAKISKQILKSFINQEKGRIF